MFGEGVVNDAVSILIFETVKNVFARPPNQESDGENITTKKLLFSLLHFIYLSLASIAIGISIGLLSAILTKKVVNLK